MKILVINDLYRAGGSELQTKRELDILRKNGENAILLTFDREYKSGWINANHYNLAPPPIIKRRVFRLFNSLKINKAFAERVKRVINEINPEVIHINNVSAETLSVYEAIGQYKCVQTLRDCRNFCPAIYGVNKKGQACDGYMHHKCYKECNQGRRLRDKLNFWLEYKFTARVNEFRLRAVDKVVAPGSTLCEMANGNGIKTTVLRDVLLESEYKNTIPPDYNGVRKYICYGRISKAKGIDKLIEAFVLFATNKNVQLLIAGSIDADYESQFKEELKYHNCIRYVGVIDHKEINMFIDEAFAVLVPSVVLENYPNTIIEGYARKRLALGTGRAGIRDIINDEKLLFDVYDRADIVRCLEYVHSLSIEDYMRTAEHNYDRVTALCSAEKYYAELMNLFSRL